jgi:hypothetical protein
MLEDQLERQKDEADKLNARYQNLLNRLHSSPPKPSSPRPSVGFGFAFASGPCLSPSRHSTSAQKAPSEPDRALGFGAPSHGFSSPLGRAISAAVNTLHASELLHTNVKPVTPLEPVGLGLLARGGVCEQATGVESPARSNITRSPFKLRLSPTKSPAQQSPVASSPVQAQAQTKVVRRSPSFAFLAAHRGPLPTPLLPEGGHSHLGLERTHSQRVDGDLKVDCSLREEEREVGGSPAFNRERTTGRKTAGSLSGDERARTRVSFDGLEALQVKTTETSGRTSLREKALGGLGKEPEPAVELSPRTSELVDNPGGEALQTWVEKVPRGSPPVALSGLPRGSPLDTESPTSLRVGGKPSQSALESQGLKNPLEGIGAAEKREDLAVESADFGDPNRAEESSYPLTEDEDQFPVVSPGSENLNPSSLTRPSPCVPSPEQLLESAFLAFSLCATNLETVSSFPQAAEKSGSGKVASEAEAQEGFPPMVKGPLEAVKISPAAEQSRNTREAGGGLSFKADQEDRVNMGHENRVNAGQEDRVKVTKALSRFQRGKQRAAELFTTLRPVTESAGQGNGVKKEEVKPAGGVGERMEPGPVGVLLQVRLCCYPRNSAASFWKGATVRFIKR